MKPLLTTLLVISLSLSAVAAAKDGHLEARRLVSEGRILPLEQILAGIRQVQPGQVLEVELGEKRHRMIYEIEMLDAQGTVWEFKVDAVTGEILEQELED